MMKELRFSAMDQQKVLVSVSELTRNIIDHAYSKGTFLVELTDVGVRLTVTDSGPGIHNVDAILEGKETPTTTGLGLGLSGVKRLMDDFVIETSTKGTKVVVTKWIGREQERF